MAGQVGDQQAPTRQQRRQLTEVPSGAAVAVNQEQRPPVPARKDPNSGAAVLDPLLVEARQEARIRHIDRLWCDDYERVGDRGKRVKLPVLRHEDLKTQPACAPCAAGFFVLGATTDWEGARWQTT